MSETLLVNTLHPHYDLLDYTKFRLTYRGGREFIDKYLEKFDSRENQQDFDRRKKLTYNPALATQALDEILAGVTQRMNEIGRKGCTESYSKAVGGGDGGVDLENSSMNKFVATRILPEMMVMGRVGVYVDMPEFNPFSTLADFEVEPHPYLYTYDACDILNWHYEYDRRRNELLLRTVLLRERHWELNDNGLPVREKEIFRLCVLRPNGVHLKFFEKQVDPKTQKQTEMLIKEYLLPLRRIPFVMFDIGKSLLNEVADVQIALLNLASADLSYAINANFPFYVEGYDPKTQNVYGKTGPTTTFNPETGEDVEDTSADSSLEPKAVVGTMHGRFYPYEAPVPAFIHPSPEPLRVSMEKQEVMERLIRKLLNLNVANVAPSRVSAEAKKIDQSSGLESGLAFIGLELAGGEREIAQIWAEYEDKAVEKTLVISYPSSYSLKTDEDRIDESEKLQGVQGAAPSRTYQKEVAKLIVKKILDGKVNPSVLEKIDKEIDNALYITGKSDEIKADFEIGIVDPEVAAEARGYDPQRVKLAQDARVQRMKEIAEAQTPGVGAANSAARGGEGEDNPDDEKELSQDSDKNPNGGKAVRGKGE